jgi:hypothetical protein
MKRWRDVESQHTSVEVHLLSVSPTSALSAREGSLGRERANINLKEGRRPIDWIYALSPLF